MNLPPFCSSSAPLRVCGSLSFRETKTPRTVQCEAWRSSIRRMNAKSLSWCSSSSKSRRERKKQRLRWQTESRPFPRWIDRIKRINQIPEGVSDPVNSVNSVSHPTRQSYSLQPWFSRTWIMLARMLFHVSCWVMTAFGNMQPSQQMCRNFFVTLPLSSRIQ